MEKIKLMFDDVMIVVKCSSININNNELNLKFGKIVCMREDDFYLHGVV